MSMPEAALRTDPPQASRGPAPPSGERPRQPDAALLLRKLRPLLILAAFALVFACLRLARVVLIPVALATLFAFLLTPPVIWLQRHRVHRIASVVLVVVLLFSVVGGLVWMLATQAAALANDLPSYRQNIRKKIADVRVFRRGGSLEKVQDTVNDVIGEMQKDDKKAAAGQRPPVPVVAAEKPFWQLPSTLGAIAETAATSALVVVLVVFMLIERQELRNRILRLFGHGRVTVTTKAIDEATQRISRYLLMQSLVNSCFGAAVAIGLFFVGVPYALLWGVLAGLLRFIPYVGTWVAATLPLVMSLAVFPDWRRTLLVLALFAVLELVIYMAIEPLLYGQSAGVSQTALLVTVAFWTWLWGSVGLLLATPLTVCLVVLGKYVPEMDFILTLMSDEPVLSPTVAYYQRLLASDQDEAAEIVDAQLATEPRERVYDEIMVPALVYARRDRARGRLTDAEVAFVHQASREIVEGTAVRPEAPEAAGGAPPPSTPRGRVLGCPARDDVDDVALAMLAELLAPAGVDVERVPADMLTAEMVQAAARARPACICIAAVPPGGQAHARYLLKRLRARFPDTALVVGRWGCKDDVDDDTASLTAAGADRVATTLAVTSQQVQELLRLATPERPLARTA